MRNALCVVLVALLLTACTSEEEEIPEAPHIPLSTQYDSYTIGEANIVSVGPYTGYVVLSDKEVEVHPHYDLPECFTIKEITLSGQDWWEHATAGIPAIEEDTYQLIQWDSGSIIGFVPISDDKGLFVQSYNLSVGYVQLYLDNIWISDT